MKTARARTRWFLSRWLIANVLLALCVFASAMLATMAWGGAEGKYAGATAPMPGDQKVPLKWLPPGSFDEDPGPSDVIFPAQQLTIRFNHKKHMGMGMKCASCHEGATNSTQVADKLLPKPQKCDSCHQTNHGDLTNVKAGAGETGACAFCHQGYTGQGNAVPRNDIPHANLVFNHKAHVTRNIACQQCHGNVEELELATRDQLPRMRGCLGCHQGSDTQSTGAGNNAKGACDTCHIKDGANGTTQLLPERRGVVTGNLIKTTFSTGTLKPPRWLHNAAHTPDFIERHKMVAANDSQFCSNCHKEDFCTGCHDGRVRPRQIHPANFLQMHPIEARMMTQKCTSCHREQSFCVTCHQRLGVAMSGPAGARETGRFHPAKAIWSDAPRKPGHHSQEAVRNLNACVGCHIERDCVTCHGAAGVGGSFNPHPANFAANCSAQFRRNPRPCLTCHLPGTQAIDKCRP